MLRKVFALLLAGLLVGPSTLAQVAQTGGGKTIAAVAGGSAAIVQKSGYGVAVGANAVVFGSAVTTGNTIIVGVFIASTLGAPSSVTDDQGNSYTQDGGGATTSVGSIDAFYVYRASNVTNAPGTVTVTVSSRNSKVVAYEVSGLTNTSPLDVFTIADGASTATPAFAFSTTSANQFAIGILSTENTGAAKTFTAGSADLAWTFDSTNTDTVWFESVAPTGASGSKTLDGSLGSPNGVWDYMIATYKTP